MDLLKAIAGTTRCASCGAVYEQADLAIVGERDGYHFMRCGCRTCGQQGLGVVIVREVAPPSSEPPPLTIDDVLAAHVALGAYTGDARALFSAKGER